MMSTLQMYIISHFDGQRSKNSAILYVLPIIFSLASILKEYWVRQLPETSLEKSTLSQIV